VLLLLDSCEHFIDAAAELAAAVLSGTPDVKILATSREPVEVQG
jgi:predicted ATPase